MDYKEKLENEISKRDLAQYAANLIAIKEYLNNTKGSSDAENAGFQIYCEIDTVIKSLLEVLRNK